MKSRVYLPFIILAIIMSCSYTPKEIPPPLNTETQPREHTIFKPIEPTIDLNILAQPIQEEPIIEPTVKIEEAEQKIADAPQEQPKEEVQVAPLKKSALHDLDFEMNNRIQWWIKRFSGPDKRYFRTTLSSFDTIRPAMEKIFESYGIPKDLVYICLIESGGRPNAISPAGATGYWQFTGDTAKNYKLSVNKWVDERRDLVKSTHAAAKYLKSLNAIFNDWLLACAAYNAGEGNLYRIIKNHPEIDTYWDISRHMPIKNETLDYVPKLIATIVLAKNRAYYGLDEPAAGSKEAVLPYETVRVPSLTYLEEIADLLKMPNKEIALMNSELVRQCTPPSDNDHEIKVPRGTAGIVETYVQNGQIKKKPVQELEKESTTHTVKKGESLYRIAKIHKISVKALRKANDLGKNDSISPGQSLVLPTNTKEITKKKEGKNTHVVAKGDTLKSLSRRYGVSVDEIMEANHLTNPKQLKVKMVLNIPPKHTTSSPRQVQYKVKKGDTIWSISRRFEVTANDVMKWNKLSSATDIFPGDKLTIRSR